MARTIFGLEPGVDWRTSMCGREHVHITPKPMDSPQMILFTCSRTILKIFGSLHSIRGFHVLILRRDNSKTMMLVMDSKAMNSPGQHFKAQTGKYILVE